jgi:hypothetical protein
MLDEDEIKTMTIRGEGKCGLYLNQKLDCCKFFL